MITALKILCKIDFPSVSVGFWDGSGPWIDDTGFLWQSGRLMDGGLDAIEMAINAEAFTLVLGLSGVDKITSDLAWEDYNNGEVIGAPVQIFIQKLDEYDQPTGSPKSRFRGKISNINWDESGTETESLSSIRVSVPNRFTLRTLQNGSVLSDTDRKAVSKILNPTAPPDRIAERVPQLIDKTVKWPGWS